MKKVFAVVAAAGLTTLGIGLAAPAQAYPWWMGSCFAGNGVDTPWGGFCDGPAVNPAGDHYHCESAPFYHGCMWKDVGNLTIGMPPGIGN